MKVADAKLHDEDLQIAQLKGEVEALKRQLEEKENEEELAVSAFEEELSAIEKEKRLAEAEVIALKQNLLNLQLATVTDDKLDVSTVAQNHTSFSATRSSENAEIPFVNAEPADSTPKQT